MQSCSSKKIEPIISQNPVNDYKQSLCLWLKPYYVIDGDFEDNLPDDVLRLMLRSDLEYNTVCLTK